MPPARPSFLALVAVALAVGARHVAATAAPPRLAPAAVRAPAVVRAPVADTVVELRLFRFHPDTLRVPAGTRVTWLNADDIAHTVVSGTPERRDGAVDLRLAGIGARASARFDAPGLRTVFCDRHPFMRGVIDVLPRGDQP